MNNKLQEIAQELNTQDNRCTSDPIFLVQELHVIHGMSTDYSDDIIWVEDCDWGEASEEEHNELEEYYDANYEEPEGWVRTAVLKEWRFVQPFFTEKAANQNHP